MSEEEKEISWGKIIVIGFIALIFLAITIFGLIQNYYALKAITQIPKTINQLEGNTTRLGGLNYVTTSEKSTGQINCYENNLQINCSVIDKYLDK